MTSSWIRAQRFVALFFLALGIAAVAIGPFTQAQSSTATLPDDSQAAIVAEMQDAAGTGDTSAAIVVLSSPTGERLDIKDVQAAAKGLGGPAIPNPDGTAALVPTSVTATNNTENSDAIEKLRADAAKAAESVGATAQVTGPAAIKADLAGVFAGANFLLLGVTALIVAVLLIITYRSPILWLLPLLVIGVADRVAATVFTWVLGALGMQWNESTSGILSVLVFGAGTNYALLLISRYRDELGSHEDRYAAMGAAWLPTLKAVTASAATVIVGVLCLVLSAIPTTRALGVASALGIVVAWTFALFVLPGLLAWCGRWVFWPKKPKLGDVPQHAFWDRVGAVVDKQPAKVAAASLAALAVCCVGYFQQSTGLGQADQFIDTPESIAASDTIAETFPEQTATPPIVATKNVQQTQATLKDLGASARPLGDPVSFQTVNDSAPADYTLLQISGADTQALRAVLPGAFVGGPDANLIDEEDYSAADRTLIFPLVLALVFVMLMVLLRSLLAPLIMVGSVLLTNVAALGLGWWVSHFVFGFEHFASSTPLFSFVFLVALGIDYTIFLVTHAREDAAAVGTRRGILTALSSTGGVITSAGILLAAVFAALGVLPLVALAQIGITIFLGVLLDTLLVRTILVPAIVQLVGEKFWWPATVRKQ
ncbi:MMPL family transporter [Corynebacterium incognita]|uniref:MMPL family transporter n=1 Tax=Corynebacterium incognita TaxID=2754725 RepID=A0A7G7CQ85_9CORY|nr:MMPL family transporter [Corynebacterium incognita]QNE89751.1 MMPL family transporter [Corynebacterium incognita]